MTDEIERTFRGAKFAGADFTGATFRECDMRQVRIIGSEIVGLHVSGIAGEIENVVVNDVDVTAFVEGELDRRYPERVQLRAVQTADDYRAMWETIERLWADTVARAERLTEAARQEQVNDEWSFVETLRHLVLATDIWVGRMVLDQAKPYHPLGLLPADYSPTDAAVIGVDAIGLDTVARPSFAEVMDVRADRMALVRGVLAGVTDAELAEIRTAEPAPGWGERTFSMGRCLRVVLREECEHRSYAVRDLAVLEARV